MPLGDAVIGAPSLKEKGIVNESIRRIMMKNGKDRGTSGFVSEMVNTAGEPRLAMTTDLVNLIIVESSISAE